MEKEIKNAKIGDTMLGYEDHGIMTIYLTLDYGGMHQNFGGYSLRGEYLFKHVEQILKAVGVDKWEDLKGKYIRVESSYTKVSAIGNLLENKWFRPADLAPTEAQ